MQGQCSITVLAVVILLFGISEGEHDSVTVNENSVTLTCPLDEPVSWYEGTSTSELGKEKSHTLSANNGISKGYFRCEANNKKSYFYVNVRVCGDCIDLGMGTVIGIICGDLLFTLLVVMGVYCFAKKRGGHSKEFRHPQFEPMETPGGRSTNTPASHEQSHYAPIKSGQRDVYDKLQR
ncbi:T-cell surface glycoprotein CD3 epsilon chain-like [Chiloscyllium punctatum]|uniref:T-cell surface glycoprotein CD3 epsilon chain-like n=1 Tax=Chiloscyllium punctatum TaxID=137246 RepID=UPI003B639715